MSTKNLNAALDIVGRLPTDVFGSPRDASRAYVVMSKGREEIAAHVAAAAALRRLLNAFPPPASEEESDAVTVARKAIASIKALEDA